jgi:hypothetical protein
MQTHIFYTVLLSFCVIIQRHFTCKLKFGTKLFSRNLKIVTCDVNYQKDTEAISLLVLACHL